MAIELKGKWKKGFALDLHTLSSEYLGEGPYDPTSTKTFLKNTTEFSEYIISHEYKGKVSSKYKPSIISLLKNKILEILDKHKENPLFKS